MKFLPAVVFVFGMARLAQGGVAATEVTGPVSNVRLPSSMLRVGKVRYGQVGEVRSVTPSQDQIQSLTTTDPAPWMEGPKTALETWLLLAVHRLSNVVGQLQVQQNSLQAEHANDQHPYIDTSLVFSQLVTVAGFRASLETNQHSSDRHPFFVYRANIICAIGNTHYKVTDIPM